jgi:hypothetical protein
LNEVQGTIALDFDGTMTCKGYVSQFNLIDSVLLPPELCAEYARVAASTLERYAR